MRSTPTEPSGASAIDDRTTVARIRDVAIACFADAGVAATSVRTIAEAAGVSPALVIHHFGSKADLRVACDEHVAETIRTSKQEAMASGPDLDPLAAVRRASGMAPLMRYLARTLVDGTPQVAELFDEMVADAEHYMADGVAGGMLRPSAHPRGRAAVLVTWTLGALVLHEHVERVLGVDLTGDPNDALTTPEYIGPVLEMYTDGVLTEEAGARLSQALVDPDPTTAPGEEDRT